MLALYLYCEDHPCMHAVGKNNLITHTATATNLQATQPIVYVL